MVKIKDYPASFMLYFIILVVAFYDHPRKNGPTDEKLRLKVLLEFFFQTNYLKLKLLYEFYQPDLFCSCIFRKGQFFIFGFADLFFYL